MRTFIHRATLVASLSLLSAPAALVLPGSALAASGGATIAPVQAPAAPATAPAGAATAPAAGAADDLETRAVSLTRPQTKSVQRRVHVRADGAMGRGTRKAIKKFQQHTRLTVTSRPNVETLRAMGLRLADKLEAKLRAAAAVVPAEGPVLVVPAAAMANAITAARSAIGTPYRSGGTTTAGFDCSGLTMWAFAQAGLELPRTSFQQYGVGTAVPKDQILAGDLVFFDSAGAGASHVGIATSPTTVISATTRGVMEHTIASGYWASHYVGARRVSEGVASA